MRRKRHSRAFWEKVIATIERGEASVDQIAHRYGVRSTTVRWWRTQLRGARRSGAIELVPVRVAAVERGLVRVLCGEIAVELDARTSLEDVAALVRALRSEPVLGLSRSVRIYFATDRVDLRRGHDGLCALVQTTIKEDYTAA